MVTIGSQASGDTGLKICTSGLRAALRLANKPHMMPSGTATTVANKKPANTVCSDVMIWSMKVGLPV